MARLFAFIVKRLLAMVVVTYLIATIVFILAHASPYDPTKIIIGKANTHGIAALRHEFGLDKPLWDQYRDYMGGLLHGNMGYSLGTDTLGQNVWFILKTGVPVSMKLGLYALALSLIVGIPVGLLSALKQNSWIDHVSQTVMMILYAVPSFVLIPICQLVFGVQLHWLPVSGWGDSGMTGVKEMVLPVTLYAAAISGFWAKSFRSFMLEVMRQDYIRTARAKGLRERAVIWLHAMKNTLLPLASIVGPTVAFLIIGAFIIETFFSIPGIGLITVQSILQSDYPVIEATTILLASFVVLVNALTDIFYAMVDPRVRL